MTTTANSPGTAPKAPFARSTRRFERYAPSPSAHGRVYSKRPSTLVSHA